MNEKTKKILMRQVYMGAVALVIFSIVFAVCSVSPSLKEGVKTALEKNTDLKKVTSLFVEIAKEII